MQPKANRNQSLDILRGVAILLVLGHHYKYFRVWYGIGWSGVDLFFVLSGFLISGLLFSEYKRSGAINVKRFWLRRGFKIYPPFYSLIGLTVGFLLLRGRPVPEAILGDLFFVQNYHRCIWQHGWSLAIEEHFYIMLPVLLLFMVRFSKNKENPFRLIPAISITLTVACLALRILAFSHGASERTIFYPTQLRIDSLFAGVTLGYFNHFDEALFARAPKASLWIAAAVFLSPVVLLANQVMAGTFTLTFLGFGCLLIATVNRKPSRNPISKLVAWIGYYSYSIYLWHAVLVVLVFQSFHPTAALFVGYIASSILLGVFMSKLIEVPSLALRDRWFPSRAMPEARSLWVKEGVSVA